MLKTNQCSRVSERHQGWPEVWAGEVDMGNQVEFVGLKKLQTDRLAGLGGTIKSENEGDGFAGFRAVDLKGVTVADGGD